MNLRGRIRLKEREIALARRALAQSSEEFGRVLHAKLSSRTALVAAFAGGVLLGWQRRRRPERGRQDQRAPTVREAGRRATEGLPPHWLRSYIVWPFLLATARDAVISRRPTRGEA